jgi:hypothetical protein
MKPKGRKNHVLGKGMELIRGGVEVTSASRVEGRRCVCSPGGWSYGNVDCGCACGCFTSPAEANRSANYDIANPNQ